MQKKLSLKDYFIISRPRFWIYTLGPFLLGIASGLLKGQELYPPILVVVILAIYFFTSANLYIYGINDIFDYETDRLNPKKAGYEMLVTPSVWKQLWQAILISQIPLLVIIPFLTFKSLLALLAFLFFAWQYSAPIIRAKARPIFDSFFSASHYVSSGLVGYYLFNNGEFPWMGVFAGILWAMAMHAYSAVPDINADKESFIDTIATSLGGKKTLIFCFLAYLVSGLIFYSFVGFAAILLTIPYLSLMFISYRELKDISKHYKAFPIINTLIGMIVFFLIAGQSLISLFN